MSSTSTPTHRETPPEQRHDPVSAGPLGRLGLWVTSHGKLVAIVWALLIVGLGLFAPQVEKNLSGAGWQANGSESVAARELA
ncbi:MAG: MMPL family transporter, partial [Nocardioides sp.]